MQAERKPSLVGRSAVNRPLYQHALDHLRRLHADWQGHPQPGSDWPFGLESAYRLIQLAAQVSEALEGTDAAGLLMEQAQCYQAETGPGTRFEETCSEARVAILRGTGARDDVAGCYGLADLYSDEDIGRTDGTRMPRAVCLDPGEHPLPITRRLGFLPKDHRVPLHGDLQEHCALLEGRLADLDVARLQLPLAVSELEYADAGLETDLEVRASKENLWQFLSRFRSLHWRGAYLISLCRDAATADENASEEVAQQLALLMPCCVLEVLEATEGLAVHFPPEQVAVAGPCTEDVRPAGGTPGRRRRRGRPRDPQLDERDRLIREEYAKDGMRSYRQVADVLAERHRDRTDWLFTPEIVRNVVRGNRRGRKSR
jgi:hypothetical protein